MKGAIIIYKLKNNIKPLSKKILRYILFLLLNSGIIYISFHYLIKYRHTMNIKMIIKYAPYIIFCIGLLLSYFFKTSKLFFLLVIMVMIKIVANEAIYQYFFASINIKIYKNLLFNLLYILMPINIIIFSLFKERGIFSVWGFIRIIFIIGQFVGIFIKVEENISYISKNYNNKLIPWNFLNGNLTNTNTKIMLLFFLVVLFILIVQDRDSINHSLVLSIITFIISLKYINVYGNFVMPILFSISGLILIIGILKSSYILAYKDELTGLASRRALERELLKQGMKYSVAMLDIDFLKKFNDRYRHDVGDQVLKMVAAMMKKTTGGAKVFRYGGEEFTLVFSGKTVDECLSHLEDLRKRIDNKTFYIRSKNRPTKKSKIKKKKDSGSNKTAHITVSIGVAEKNKDLKKPDNVIKAADKALYKAKKKGRNRVVSK